MARANRHHLPGYAWHITHRCHKREFLFKFDKDKKRWTHWLFEAKKRFGLKLNWEQGQWAAKRWRIMQVMNLGNPKALTTMFLPLESVL
jgi:hypothetical protein